MNVKFFEKQLSDLKRSNKERKLKIAMKYGYETAEAYKAALEEQISSAPKEEPVQKEEIPTIHNIHILDNSGSMNGDKFNNAKKGIKAEIDELKKSNIAIFKQTFAHFKGWDSTPSISDFYVDIDNFTFNDSLSANCATPLYSTIVETLSKVDLSLSDKVLVKIFTDGKDNRSDDSDLRKAKELVELFNQNGNTVTFVGTKYDVEYIKRELSISDSNTLVHDNTARGVAEAFKETINATVSYTKAVSRGEDVTEGFYSKKIGKL